MSQPATAVTDASEEASVDPLVLALARARTAENLAVFEELECLARIWTAWLPSEETRREDRRRRRRDVSAVSLHEAEVVSEAAAAMYLTEGAAGRRVDAAVALLVTSRLPLTARLARRGRLDWRRIDALVVKTRQLSAEDAAAVEAKVLVPTILPLTIGRFENAVDRAVIAVDPAAAEERRREVVRGRRVSFFKNRNLVEGTDGGATLWAEGPSEGLSAAWAVIDATARWYRGQGDPRALDQLRHDLLVAACTTGRVDAPQDLVTEALVESLRSTGGKLPVAAGSSGGAVYTRRPHVPVHLDVTVSLQTLLGLNDHPGTLDGFGPVTAQMVRDMAQNAIWRCVAVDDTHGTVLGVGRTTYSHGYTPGADLRSFLDVAAPVCEVPWCTAKAERCDLDHRRPFDRGGATCVCNVGPTCRRHHREKSAGDLTVRRSTNPDHPPGTNIWTTPGGREVVQFPHAPLPPEAYTVAGSEPAAGAEQHSARAPREDPEDDEDPKDDEPPF